MQCEECHSSVLRLLSLLPEHVKETGAFRAVRLLGAVDTSDQFGLVKHGGEPNAAAVADGAREPAPVRFLTRWLDLGLGLGVDSRRRRRRGGSHARGPFHRLAVGPAVNQPLSGGPWMPAAYAEGQSWTRDPRGSRVLSHSPRIPHGKETTWLKPIKIPCQEAVIG
ncbi:hypothetical protein [Tessaracoccus sp. Y1736]